MTPTGMGFVVQPFLSSVNRNEIADKFLFLSTYDDFFYRKYKLELKIRLKEKPPLFFIDGQLEKGNFRQKRRINEIIIKSDVFFIIDSFDSYDSMRRSFVIAVPYIMSSLYFVMAYMTKPEMPRDLAYYTAAVMIKRKANKESVRFNILF